MNFGTVEGANAVVAARTARCFTGRFFCWRLSTPESQGDRELPYKAGTNGKPHRTAVGPDDQRTLGELQASRPTKGSVLTGHGLRPKAIQAIADQIIRLLTQHYRFTSEEQDFIINCDIKYRPGREG